MEIQPKGKNEEVQPAGGSLGVVVKVQLIVEVEKAQLVSGNENSSIIIIFWVNIGTSLGTCALCAS